MLFVVFWILPGGHPTHIMGLAADATNISIITPNPDGAIAYDVWHGKPPPFHRLRPIRDGMLYGKECWRALNETTRRKVCHAGLGSISPQATPDKALPTERIESHGDARTTPRVLRYPGEVGGDNVENANGEQTSQPEVTTTTGAPARGCLERARRQRFPPPPSGRRSMLTL